MAFSALLLLVFDVAPVSALSSSGLNKNKYLTAQIHMASAMNIKTVPIHTNMLRHDASPNRVS